MTTSPTAYSIIEQIKNHVTCYWRAETVDTFKAGDPSQPVTGIATTFMATYAVLEQAAAQGCNLIITHEPTYYNHRDEQDTLENDPVYTAKQALIAEHNLIIFRFHDHWHLTSPDGIYVGMLEKLQWGDYRAHDEFPVFALPQTTMGEILAHLTDTFPTATIRVIGDPQLRVQHTALMVGASGFGVHRQALQEPNINLAIIGEVPEWETIAYVRDAADAGHPKAMIILGHAISEEAGMDYCATWLQTFIGEVPVRFIPAGDPFHR